MTTKSAFSAVLLLCAACAAEESHPPLLGTEGSTSGPLPVPVTCAGLRTRGSDLEVSRAGSVLLAEDAAACLADGLECPLADLTDVGDLCDAGPSVRPRASCELGHWSLRCDVTDASTDSARAGD